MRSRVFQLSFKQRIGLGFAFVILLLLASGISSLWNLNAVNGSTSRLNQSAVPVLKESNLMQIQLLKLARLSALAFNAENKESIRVHHREFETGLKEFDAHYQRLESHTESDSDMQTLVIGIKSNYDFYRFAIDEMFEAQLGTINSKESVLTQATSLKAMVQTIKSASLQLQNFKAPEEYSEQMNQASSFAKQADGYVFAITHMLNDLQNSSSISKLGLMNDFGAALDNSRRSFNKGAELFRPFGGPQIIYEAELAYNKLKSQLDVRPSIIELKTQEFAYIGVAKQKFNEADSALKQSISGLDELLQASDRQLSSVQGEVFASLDLGFKISLGVMLVLVLLVGSHFKVLSSTITRKMTDLIKLNKLGSALASVQSQQGALEEVLQDMNERMGVSEGSVFLMNEKQELVVSAHFPPKSITSDTQPKKFHLGEGVLGGAAKTREIIFVSNTERDKLFVANDSSEPAKTLLCVPLLHKGMTIGVLNLSGNIREVNFTSSDYYYVSALAKVFVMSIKNLRMAEVSEERNKALEVQLRKRRSELQKKNQDIASIMDNLHHGVFTINDIGLVYKEYTACLENIFETDRIAGRNVNDLLFAHTNLSEASKANNLSAIEAIIGEDQRMFEFKSHRLIKLICLKIADGREKTLALDWSPISSADNVVRKLMVTVRDLSEVRELEDLVLEQKTELELIAEVLAVDAAKFAKFLRASKQKMSACHQAIRNNAIKEQDVISELHRNMQSVKAGARTYGLSYLTDIVHDLDGTYEALRTNPALGWDQQALLEELEKAQEVLAKYDYTFRDKLARDGEVSKGVSLDPERVASWLDSMKNLTRGQLDGDVKNLVSEAYNILLSIESKPLSNVIADTSASLSLLAQQLDKPEPKLQIEDANVFIDGCVHSVLNTAFTNITRNALEHSIESEQERISKGKPPHGTIAVRTSVANGFACFTVQDDGKGFALDRIRALAITNGWIDPGQERSAEQIADLIFTHNFSSSKQTSESEDSGLVLVRGLIEQEGGSIQLVLRDVADDQSQGEPAFHHFEFRITLPEKFYTEIISFSRSA